MQGLSFKFGERRDDWRCCFCCHVRTATIFLGIWHLLLHVLTLSVFAVVLRHPELMVQNMPSNTVVDDNGQDPGNSFVGSQLPTPQSSSDVPNLKPYNNYDGIAPNRLYTYQHMNVNVVVMFSTFAITLLMVYGAIKGKPSYLMPFFCLQLFDFCIASLTALSSICYLPDMHRFIAESPKVPLQAFLDKLSPQVLAFVVLFVFVAAMFIKAYLIKVVWSCYKYLTLRLIAASRTLHFVQETPPPDFQDLLPDYETACTKFPPAQRTPPPPTYSQAVAAQPHPAPSNAA